jgi:hypothetical protein
MLAWKEDFESLFLHSKYKRNSSEIRTANYSVQLFCKAVKASHAWDVVIVPVHKVKIRNFFAVIFLHNHRNRFLFMSLNHFSFGSVSTSSSAVFNIPFIATDHI